MKHLIFYEGDCPFCNRSVAFILKADQEKIFLFAPLEGETAKKVLNEIPESLVLIENYHEGKREVLKEGKAVLRICWLLKGKYRAAGLFSFLPSALFDVFYRAIAKRRYQIFPSQEKIDPKDYQGRFLS